MLSVGAVFPCVHSIAVSGCSISLCPQYCCQCVQYFPVSTVLLSVCAVFPCVHNIAVSGCSISLCPQYCCQWVQYFPVSTVLLSVGAVFPCVHSIAVSGCSISLCPQYCCQCVQCFPVSTQCYGCQCLGFLTCAQMSMRAIAHGGCTDNVRESALKFDSGKNCLPHPGLEPASVPRLPFQSDALPTELSPPPREIVWGALV